MIPRLTIVQMAILSIIIAYAISARKMNGAVVSTLALTILLLHGYDHLFMVKRGEERKIVLKSGYHHSM